jgi:Cdc6-like AAA superfamily ATPase
MDKNNNNGLSDTLIEYENDSSHRPKELRSGDWFYHEDVINKIKEIFNHHPEEKLIILQGNSGSGKTSTIKQIANKPGMLGKNYIPIYLDSTKYIDIDMDDLSFYLYQDITDKLINFGYNIQGADSIKKRRKKFYTIESFLLSLDVMLKTKVNDADKTLVLIFDEFDKFLDNVDIKAISDYIKYYSHIDKSWNNYGLILTGDKKLMNLTSSEIINQLLEKAHIISIEEIVAEENIKKLIIEPAKGKFTYDDDAIKRITWYSGKNLYFQQLICQYLDKSLIKKKRNRCLIKDVEHAVQQILKDPIQEFIYGWENKISLDARLIASALADETVTEKKGNFYYLKENTLLNDIYGVKLHEEIKKLQDFGYFNKIEGRRFPGFPFKIPLYGQWIKTHHPFIKTVSDNLQVTADKIGLAPLKKIINEISKYRSLPFDRSEVIEIIDYWLLLKNIISPKQSSAGKVVRSCIENFINKISRFLRLNIKSQPGANNYFIFDIKELGIGILEDAYCFVQDRAELKKEDIRNIETLAEVKASETHTKSTIFFYFQKSDMVENFVKKPYLNLIALEENDLKKIVISLRPVDTFKKIILSRLSMQKISPYNIDGPALKATFYGRGDVINKIIGKKNKSFSIVGGRKIGKTSLLYKLYDDPAPNTRCILMNLESSFANVKNYKKFILALESKIEEEFKKKNAFGRLSFTKSLDKLPHIIRMLSKEDKRLLFIFDEIDSLLDFDRTNHYELIKMFRGLSQEDTCQFIFAGFKELYKLKRDIKNPLYNFCEEIKLQPLDKQPALELITRPMENMGVHYKDEGDKELILFYTGCHPNFLQYFCMKLVEKIEKHEKAEDRRTIFKSDIEEIYHSDYQEYILDDVYMFKTDMSAVNRLILVFLVEDRKLRNGIRFPAEKIKNKLAAQSIEISDRDLHLHLKHLVMRFVLVDEGKDNYRFALPVFPEILEQRIDDDYKNRIIKEIKENAPESL